MDGLIPCAAPTCESRISMDMVPRAGGFCDSCAGTHATPTELLLAARAGDLAKLRQTMAGGVDKDASDRWQRTPLYMAARAGHAEVVRALLEAGAAVDSVVASDPETRRDVPLRPEEIRAVEERVAQIGDFVHVLGGAEASDLEAKLFSAIARAPIPRSRTVNEHCYDTPLKTACRCGHAEIVRLLIAAGANLELAPGGNNQRPLYLAALLGRMDIVRPLLEAGADVDARSEFPWKAPKMGKTALDAAVRHGHDEVVQALRQAGATDETTVALRLLMAVEAQDLPAVRRLLEEGADPNGVTNDLTSPFLRACSDADPGLVEAFTSAGARVTGQALENLARGSHWSLLLRVVETAGSQHASKAAITRVRRSAKEAKRKDVLDALTLFAKRGATGPGSKADP